MKQVKIILLLCLIAICGLASIHIQAIKNKILYSDKPIHIFYESLATQPALSGMIEMVQLPKDELKLFAWHRFPNRSQLLDLKQLNAIEIPIHYTEGYVVINAKKVISVVEQYLKKHPKSPVIIYTNMNNYNYFFSHFLPKIDKNRIKRIHVYEDGLGELFTHSTYFQHLAFNQKDINDLQNYYYDQTKKTTLPQHAKHMLHTLLPTTYHFYGLTRAQKMPLYHSFFKEMTGADFKEINFQHLTTTLTSEQKNLLFKLIGLDYDYYKKLFHNKKTFMYLTGFHNTHNHAHNHAELAYLKTLMNKFPTYKFFIKPHPSYSALNRTQSIQELFPSATLITPQIPYEVFIIADLVPTRISGYASSLFYTVPHHIINSYFPHPAYIKGFNLLNKFKKVKKLNLKTYIPPQPLFYDFIINKNNQKEYVILQNKTNAFLYLEKKIYKINQHHNQLIICSEKNCDIYIKNGDEYNYTPNNVLKVNHQHWSDFLVHKEKNIYCRSNNDCGQATQNENEFKICWDKWGCETFVQNNNTYLLKNSQN